MSDDHTHSEVEPTEESVPPVDNYSMHVMSWAKNSADVVEDVSAGVLGFIPNGIASLYDQLLKPLPHAGAFFQDKWAEETIKFFSGATIGQVIARDVARFFFRPIGFAAGAFLGSGAITDRQPKQPYQNQIGDFLYRASAQAVGGAFVCMAGLGFAHYFMADFVPTATYYGAAFAVGGVIGLTYKAMMMVATNTVTAANAASTRLNAERAKKFSIQLKTLSKEKVRDKVKQHATDIIEQIYGTKSEDWDAFFEQHLEDVAVSLDKKIDRHLNLLTSRAVHGDFKALKTLATLYPRKGKKADQLEQFLERVFNQRAVFHIKDAADTFYDHWQYRSLKA